MNTTKKAKLCGEVVTIVIKIDKKDGDLVVEANFDPPLEKGAMASSAAVIAIQAIKYAELFSSGEVAEVENLPRIKK